MTWRDAPVFQRIAVDSNGCWNWTGYVWANGYGCASVVGQSKSCRAHRLAWEVVHGPIPKGLGVLHRCDNRRCINPGHLFLGTPTDNNRDMAAKGRSRNQTARLTPTQVECIRRARACGIPRKTLAQRYGVTPESIWRAATRRSWRTA